MRGTAMSGWLRVDDSVLDEDAFAGWVRTGVAYASSLPVKG
jgi:hypothetical protein